MGVSCARAVRDRDRRPRAVGATVRRSHVDAARREFDGERLVRLVEPRHGLGVSEASSSSGVSDGSSAEEPSGGGVLDASPAVGATRSP